MKIIRNLLKIGCYIVLSGSMALFSCSSEMDKFQDSNVRPEDFDVDIPGTDLYDIVITDTPYLQDSFGDVDEHQFSQYVYNFMPELYEELDMERVYILNMFLRTYFMMDPYRDVNTWWVWLPNFNDIDQNILPQIMQQLKYIVNRVNNQNTLGNEPEVPDDFPEWPAGGNFVSSFYDYLDVLNEADISISKDLVEVMKKAMYYINDSYGIMGTDGKGYDTYGIGWPTDGYIWDHSRHPELQRMEERTNVMKAYLEEIDGLGGDTGTTIPSAFDVLGKAGSKLMVQANDNLYVDTNGDMVDPDPSDINTGLGNAARGIGIFLDGVYEFLDNEEFEGGGGSDFLSAENSVTDPSPDSSADVMKAFIEMLESYQTVNGTKFTEDAYRNQTTTGKYYNAEMRNFILEFFPILQSMMINGENIGSILSDHGGMFAEGELDNYPLALFADAINNDGTTGNKGLNLNLDTLDTASSVETMMRYDPGLRTRINRSGDDETEKWSHMERLCWILVALDHLGNCAGAYENSSTNWTAWNTDYPFTVTRNGESGLLRYDMGGLPYAYDDVPEDANYIEYAVSNRYGDRPISVGRGHGIHVPYITLYDGMYNLRTLDNTGMGINLANLMGAMPSMKYKTVDGGGYISNMNMNDLFGALGGLLSEMCYYNGDPQLEMSLYGLFGDRPAAPNTWINASPFEASTAAADRHYWVDVHTNAPVLVHIGGEVTGDLGLPRSTDPLWNTDRYTGVRNAGIQGGRSYGSSEVAPLPETWIDQDNNNKVDRWARTWVPYCKDGLGVVTTVEWLFSWLVRAGVMGHAPFYSLQDADHLGGNIYKIYNPDGTVYGYVNRTGDSAGWKYYPENPIGKDAAWLAANEGQGTRFKHKWDSSFMLTKLEGIDKGTVYTGTHTGAGGAQNLTDTTKTFPQQLAGLVNEDLSHRPLSGSTLTIYHDTGRDFVTGAPDADDTELGTVTVPASLSSTISVSSGIRTGGTLNLGTGDEYAKAHIYFEFTSRPSGFIYLQYDTDNGPVIDKVSPYTYKVWNITRGTHCAINSASDTTVNCTRLTYPQGDNQIWWPGDKYRIVYKTGNNPPRYYTFDQELYEKQAGGMSWKRINMDHDITPDNAGDYFEQLTGFEQLFQECMGVNTSDLSNPAPTKYTYVGMAFHVPPENGSTSILIPSPKFDVDGNGAVDDTYLTKVYWNGTEIARDDGNGNLVDMNGGSIPNDGARFWDEGTNDTDNYVGYVDYSGKIVLNELAPSTYAGEHEDYGTWTPETNPDLNVVQGILDLDFPENYLVGSTVYNLTDGSQATITSNRDESGSERIVGSLSGGTVNEWDDGDRFLIVKSSHDISTLRADFYRDPMGSTDSSKKAKSFQIAELVGDKYMYEKTAVSTTSADCLNDNNCDAKYPYVWRPNPNFKHEVRECATHEESVYRNMHWWLFEKKYALALPMPLAMKSNITMPGPLLTVLAPVMVGCGGTGGLIEGLTATSLPLGDMTLNGGAVMAMCAESNGAFGLLNMRRLEKSGGSTGNNKWALDNTYAYSTRPGDYRFSMIAGGGEIAADFAMNATVTVTLNEDLGCDIMTVPVNMASEINSNTIMGVEFAWENMFERYGGTLLPAVASENLDVLYNLIYLVPGMKEKCLWGDNGGTADNPRPADVIYSTSSKLGGRWTSATNPTNPPPPLCERTGDGIYWANRNQVMPIGMAMFGAWRDSLSTKPMRKTDANITSLFPGGSVEYPRVVPGMELITKGMLTGMVKPVQFYQNDPGGTAGPLTNNGRSTYAPVNMWKFELDEAVGPPPRFYHRDRDNNDVTGWNSGWSSDPGNYGTYDDVLTDFRVYEGAWWLASQADYIDDNDFDTDDAQNPNPFYISGGSGVCADQYIDDPEEKDGYGFNGYDYDNKAKMRTHFIPRYRKTLIGMLALSPAVDAGVDPEASNYLVDPEKNDIDGLITLNTSMMKSGMEILYKLGSTDYDDDLNDDGYIDEYDPDDSTTWGARRKIFYGLEQIMTTIKSTEGDQLFEANGAPGFDELAREKEWCKIIDLPKSLVDNSGAQLRDADIKLTDMLNEFIDDTDPATPATSNQKGLSALPQNRGDWSNYFELFENAKELMTDNGLSGGVYNMSDQLEGMLDAVKGNISGIEPRHFFALIHTMGIVLSEYDGSSWDYPTDGTMTSIVQKMGDLMDVFIQHEALDMSQVDGYYALMKVMLGDLKYDGTLGEDKADWEANYRWDEGLLKDGGLVEYMMQNMTNSDPASVSMLDIEDMLNYMSYSDPLWTDVSDMLLNVLEKYNWKDTPEGVDDTHDL